MSSAQGSNLNQRRSTRLNKDPDEGKQAALVQNKRETKAQKKIDEPTKINQKENVKTNAERGESPMVVKSKKPKKKKDEEDKLLKKRHMTIDIHKEHIQDIESESEHNDDERQEDLNNEIIHINSTLNTFKTDSSYIPSNENSFLNDPLKFKSAILSEEDMRYLALKSNDFTIPYGKLKIKKDEYFKDRSESQINTIKNVCYYRHSLHKNKDYLIEKKKKQSSSECGPDIFISLLSPNVDNKHVQCFAGVLSRYLPDHVKKIYTDREVDKMISQLKNTESMEDMAEILKNVPNSLKLKSTAKALQIFGTKNQNQLNVYYTSWFTHCVRPLLGKITTQNLECLNSTDVLHIKRTITQPHLLDEQEALNCCKLLKQGQILDLDDCFKNFKNMSDQFWQKLIKEICKVKTDIADVWLLHKDRMITQALYTFYRQFSMTLGFAETVAKFLKMDFQSLNELQLSMNSPLFTMFLEFLDQGKPQDFSLFKSQIDHYLQLTKQEHIDACQVYLKKAPLERWHEYKHIILHQDFYLNQQDSLRIVKEQFESLFKLENLAQMDLKTRKDLELKFDDVFKNLSKKILLHQFDWQKEIVVQLVYLITRLNKKSILIQIDTGHGKSVIIQLLADMLCREQVVNIVCLNSFLAHWSNHNYGSANTEIERIQYMDFSLFCKKKSNNQVGVIFDEVDKMIGSNSFDIIECGDTMRCIYRPQFMSEWKFLVGFSGTVSKTTQSLLRPELDNAIFIEIPNLRVNQSLNKITKVIQTTQESLNAEILARITELSMQTLNFIVILEGEQSVKSFVETEAIKDTLGNRKLIVFTNFEKDFAVIEKNLKQLTEDQFVVVTTREGGRGVDFKGTSSSHVIIGFDVENYAEAMQCLGRGSRALNKSSEGTIICTNPKTTKAADFLELLSSNDREKAIALKLNAKIAKALNGIVVKSFYTGEELARLCKENAWLSATTPQLSLIMFRTVMREGTNLQKWSDGMKMWKHLKLVDAQNKLPESLFDWP